MNIKKKLAAEVQQKIVLTPEVLEEIERDENKFCTKLGWKKSDFSLLSMIQQGLIEIVGRKDGELVYTATQKGINYASRMKQD